MNNQELTKKVHDAVANQISQRGYTAPVDVLMAIGILTKQKYEEWRNGRVDYLERVCTSNLSKLSLAMHEIRSCAQKMGLKPSISQYRQWGGKGAKRPLRFSKSGNPGIEKWYATHFVDEKRVAALKAQQQKAPEGE